MNNSILYAIIGEFLGTFILVAIGCGSLAISSNSIGLLGVSLSFGIGCLIATHVFGSISGGHFNPAITLCLSITGHCPKIRVPLYIVAQILGAIAASACIAMIVSGQPDFSNINGIALNGFGHHSPHKYSMMGCLGIEVIVTTVLLMVVLWTTGDDFSKPTIPFILASTFVTLIMIAGPITNASLNLARSIGPAVVSFLWWGVKWGLRELWLFAIAHIVAVIIAAVLYHVFKKTSS